MSSTVASSRAATDATDDSLSTARGIIFATLLSLPFWALVAFAVYAFAG